MKSSEKGRGSHHRKKTNCVSGWITGMGFRAGVRQSEGSVLRRFRSCVLRGFFGSVYLGCLFKIPVQELGIRTRRSYLKLSIRTCIAMSVIPVETVLPLGLLGPPI